MVSHTETLSQTNPGPTQANRAPTRLTLCRYGADASSALRQAIERVRQTQPLATVTIVAPTLATGFSAKQELAWQSLLPEAAGSALGAASTSAKGVFGVRLFTPEGLGEHIVSICDPVAHVPRYSPKELLAALMQLDSRHFGMFAPMRQHPATYEVLIQTIQELERLPANSLAELHESPSPQIKDLLRLHATIHSHFQPAELQTQRRCSAASMLRHAIEILAGRNPQNQDSLWEYLGSLIIHLPQQLSSTEAKLLQVCQPAEIILGLTGVDSADETPLASLRKIDASLLATAEPTPADPILATPASAIPASAPPAPAIPASAPPTSLPRNPRYLPTAATTAVASAPTPADEVRLAVRSVATAIQAGFPADRLAIAYTANTPYKRLLYEHLEASRISFTHFSDLPLKERVAPKALLSMLDLLDNDFRRRDLMNLLASAPIAGDTADASAWNRISAEARIHQGASQWQERLDLYIDRRNREIELLKAADSEDETDSDSKIQAIKRSIAQATSLASFVRDFAKSLKAIQAAQTWQAKRSAVAQHLDKFMPAQRLREMGSGQISPSGASPSAASPDPALPSAASPNPTSPDSFEPLFETRAESEALAKLTEILNSLASLDDLHPNPTQHDFRLLLERELEAASGRQGNQNIGVLLTDTSKLLAGSFSHIWILGLVEGYLPRKIHEDSLLPESIRRQILDLETNASQLHKQQRHFLAALRLASQQLSLSYPRLNPLGGSTSLPSRWLLEVMESLSGDKVFAEDLDEYVAAGTADGTGARATAGTAAVPDIGADAGADIETSALELRFIPSYTADLNTLELPAREQEFNLATLLPHQDSQPSLQKHNLASRKPSFARGVEAHFARLSTEFTRFDGNLTAAFAKTGQPTTQPADPGQAAQPANPSQPTDPNNPDPNNPDPAGIFADPISATRLEKWAECPQRFFMESVLKLVGIEPLDSFAELSPLVKGNIIHQSLEEFFNEILKQGPLDPSHTWQPAEQDQLAAIAARHCQDAIDQFMFGPEVFHRQEQAGIQQELAEFLLQEAEFRRSNNSRPWGLEVAFGKDQPFEYELAPGISLRLQGRIDRIDVATGAGSSEQLIIIDYKSGKHNNGKKPYRFVDLSESNPDACGRKLQMPLYLKAAEQRVRNSNGSDSMAHAGAGAAESSPASTAPNAAVYWFVNKSAKYHQQRLDFSSETTAHLEQTLLTIHSQVSQGVFPAGLHADQSSRDSNCPWCNSDSFGLSRYATRLAAKTQDPQLLPWLQLAYPDQLAQ